MIANLIRIRTELSVLASGNQVLIGVRSAKAMGTGGFSCGPFAFVMSWSMKLSDRRLLSCRRALTL